MDMSEQTLEALNGSIFKWQKIVDAFKSNPDNPKYEENGIHDCPLCDLYYSYKGKLPYINGCNDLCPVKRKTKKNFCMGSPYRAHIPGPTNENFKNAKAMLKFLKKLKPK